VPPETSLNAIDLPSLVYTLQNLKENLHFVKYKQTLNGDKLSLQMTAKSQVVSFVSSVATRSNKLKKKET
jgi:hypothetical protein